MEIVIKAKIKITFATEEENTSMQMVAIILVIGKKVKWMGKVSSSIATLTLSMTEIGKTITMKEQEDSWVSVLIGQNMKVSLLVGKCRALVKCGFMMVKDIKDSFEMIFLGGKEECLAKLEKSKMDSGREEISFLNFDNHVF
jgi:hypothetical protein